MTGTKVLPWGPHTWYAIHYVALGYPSEPCENDKRIYKAFFENLGHVLPCKRCTVHYNDNLVRMPLTDEVMRTTDTLFRWTVDIHNEVNKQTGKRTYTYEEAQHVLMTLGDEKKVPAVSPTPARQHPAPVAPKRTNYALVFALIAVAVIALIALIFVHVRGGAGGAEVGGAEVGAPSPSGGVSGGGK
jgi:hypothetical protein